ncbi:hydrolase [Uliginosibacterium sediminicola]|uniref:Hydrolase n=1 Tax=Uliginosibacterium sediminicola TaxID=2024550 RepID=A0ABU9Z328_9RHOO
MSYESPAWLLNGHLQTIWPLLIKGSLPKLKRRRWETPDGDFIDLDFLPHQDQAPLVVLFHGLEGSSRSHYARALLRKLATKAWNGVVVHFRGCSGEPNRLLRAYHSGDADEIDWILQRLALQYPGVPIYAAGVSLGGNALLCWLGSRPHAYKLITKAAAISAPLDLSAAGIHLARGFNKIYTRHFLRSMRANARQKAQQFPGQFDAERAVHADTLFDFDDAYTAPVHGFGNVHAYWKQASAKPRLADITLPTLVINARNDPFLPAQHLPHKHEVSPLVTLEQPAQGGHVGFVSGAFPGNLDWLPERLISYFER